MAIRTRPVLDPSSAAEVLEPAAPRQELAPRTSAPRRAPLAPAPGASRLELQAGEESPLPLDGATLALSLPVALALGQLNVPAAAGWAAVLIVYKAVTAPGVVRGTIDAVVDGLNVEGNVRARLGVPLRPAGAQQPSARWSTPGAAVRGWQAAVTARREGQVGRAGEAAPAPAPAALEAGGGGHGGRATAGTAAQSTSLATLLDTTVTNARASAEGEPMTLAETLDRLPAIIPLRDLALHPNPLAVPLGVTPAGEARWVDIAEDVVNVGVYGTTGAGKDSLLFQWFVLLCRRNAPEVVQFIVLDGKGDWLVPQLRGLAHMRVDPAGGYGNVEVIEAALRTIHREARERERVIFTEGGYRNREHYVAATGRPLPILVVIVTDLMTTVQGMVEEELAELISKARALGIRVVMSFQNPTGKGMDWRSNIGLVLAGCMVDGSQDPVVLGIRRLQDMRYRPSQLPNPKRSDPSTRGVFVVRHGTEQFLVKTPYLNDDELLALCARLPRRVGAVAQPVAEPEPEPPTNDPLLAALLHEQLPAEQGQSTAPQRRSRLRTVAQEAGLGRRRGRTGAKRPAQPVQPAMETVDRTPLPAAGGGGELLLPPPSAPPLTDDRLYRMMCVPLGFNQIYLAVGTDRTVLLRRCNRIRQERGLGPWPRRRTKGSPEIIKRMLSVPMGFNEIHRALKGWRGDLNKLCQELRAQHDMDGLDAVHAPVS